MTAHPYPLLIRMKQWADLGLYGAVARDGSRLDAFDASIMPRILDHIHVVDRIFQHHLQGRPHGYSAPRSDQTPDIATLAAAARATDAWYVDYVDALPAAAFGERVDFVFTSGKPARMTRGEILLHVCLHGTYHRGNAGILLQKVGSTLYEDAVTDYLEAAA